MNYTKSDLCLKRALRTIPHATQSNGKSHKNYAVNQNPLFAKSGSGALLTDVDGNQWIDLEMGLGSVILGYNDVDVIREAIECMKMGFQLSLPTELEFVLAEQLCDLIPNIDYVRFFKNGSDATAAAIRIARAKTKKDLVISCGYHGCQDWFISSTSKNSGVPSSFKSLIFPTPYGDIEKLEEIFHRLENNVAAFILEPIPKTGSDVEFLETARKLSDLYGTQLIFDEVFSGFRSSLSGAADKTGVIPDLITQGKCIANGFPLSFVAGSKKNRQFAEDVFLTNTFAGERLSLCAAQVTINKLLDTGLSKIHKTDEQISSEMKSLLGQFNLSDFYEVIGEKGIHSLAVRRTLPQASPPQAFLTGLLRSAFSSAGFIFRERLNFCLAHSDSDVLQRMTSQLPSVFSYCRRVLDESSPETLNKYSIRPIWQKKHL